MEILSRLFGRSIDHDPLGKLNLEDESLKYQGIKDGIRLWYTPDGDGVGLYYHGIPPDLPREQPTIAAFCAQYRVLMQGDVVETGIEDVADLSVVRIIRKAPQTPTGITYVGSYTVPFRDFSYVIKIQCEERGMTGIRESVLIDKGLARGEIELDDTGNIIGELSTDDAIYDHEFPDHPLSRCRRSMRMIALTMNLDEEIRRLPKFELPGR